MKDNERLQNDNARMRYLLKQITWEYGKRSKYTGNLFTSQYQPYLIQQAMEYAGIAGNPEIETLAGVVPGKGFL